MTLSLAVTAALIALNGCFVLAEFALVKVRASRLELLARKGNTQAVLVQDILHNLDLYLSACQLGITMTSLGLGWIGEPAVARLLDPWVARLGLPWSQAVSHGVSFALAFAAITFLHIVVGELVPRSVAIQRADIVSLWVALPLKIFRKTFSFPITFMADVSIAILKVFRLGAASEADAAMSEEELRIVMGSPDAEKGGFSLERLLLLENVFDFAQAKVAEAMTPRDKVAYLSLARTWPENLAVVRERRFSRYPLCEKDLDTPLGVVHVKDLVLGAMAGPEPPDLAALKRPLVEVTPSEPLQKLLQSFPDRGIHMALVRDPEKKVAGIVTLEDILEEIVGEVQDEFDLPQAWSLSDLVVPAAVEIGIEVPDPQDLIRRLIGRLKSAVPSLDAEEAMKVVWEREAKFSSAVGHGVAIPHGRLASLDRPLIALGRGPKFPFQAPDKTPVRLAFLILTPAGAPVVQLKILARIASLVSNENLRRRLLRAKTAEQLLDILKTADTVLASP